MALDKIVVLVLALVFFGGIFLLAVKSRKNKDLQPAPPLVQNAEGSPSQAKPGERNRQKAKNREMQ